MKVPRFSLVDTKPMAQSFLSLVRLLHEAKPDSPYYNVLIGSADNFWKVPRFSLVDTKPMTQSFLSLVRLLHETKADSPYYRYNVLIGSADNF